MHLHHLARHSLFWGNIRMLTFNLKRVKDVFG